MFLFIKSLATLILSPITYNFNNFSLFLYLIIITTSFHTRSYITFFQSPEERHYEEQPCGAPFYLNSTNTKDRNILLNKPTAGSVCGGVCCGLPFIFFSYERHRLHSGISDDLNVNTISIDSS